MEKSETRSKIVQTASILVVVILFYIALYVLRREIRSSHFEDVVLYLRQMPNEQFLLVFLSSMASYLALTFYDALGFWHIKKAFQYPKVALTSFISYSFSHNIGAAAITGGGIRYRFYSAMGLTAGETANVLVICGMTYWVGFLTMGSLFFFLQPPNLPDSLHLPFHSVLPLGLFCILMLSAYLLMSVFVQKNLKVFRWHFPMPSLKIALGQMTVGSFDWIFSGGALYLLLPSHALSFVSFLGIYLLAQIVGFISQVPGGLGVLEAVMIVLLEPVIPRANVLGALLAFRLFYYLIPFVLGQISFAVYEIFRNKEGFKRALQILNRWAPDFLPYVYAVLVFVSGSTLLFSNTSPEVNRQMIWLNEFLPLSILESAHFLTGIAGAWLLVLGRGLQQRLESAYRGALVLLGLAILGCFFKGFAYQEALLLLGLLIALSFSHQYFPRKGSIFQQRYPPFWLTLILFVWLGSIWLGIFNYHYEDYSTDLWTTFNIVEDAARFLRSSLGVTVALFIFSIICLVSPTQPETEFPNPEVLDQVQEASRNSHKASAGLALLGDKAILLNKSKTAFLMYAIEGKSWIVLGDPLGHEKDREDLVLRFNEICRNKKAMPVFYQVDQNHFQFYLNLGLTVLKISEEARVPLASFELVNLSADLKNNYQRFKEKEDYQFEVVPSELVAGHIKELRFISESWLSHYKTREKGFSTGFFKSSYIKHFPVGIVRKEGKIVAFTNLMLSHAKSEASVDLFRSASEEPKSLDDYLLMETMLWAKVREFHWFNLGTAGILDMEESPLAPFENRMKEILSPYKKVPHLMEIRKEKDRFKPEWSPKYLAYSANLSLEVAFHNIASLISRGHRAG